VPDATVGLLEIALLLPGIGDVYDFFDTIFWEPQIGMNAIY
jgi:hypothetical protein